MQIDTTECLCPMCMTGLGPCSDVSNMRGPLYDAWGNCPDCRDGNHGTIEDGTCVCCRWSVEES